MLGFINSVNSFVLSKILECLILRFHVFNANDRSSLVDPITLTAFVFPGIID